MKKKSAHNAEPLSFVPILAMLGQLEDVVGSLSGVHSPAKILALLAQLKNLLGWIGAIIEGYNELLKENSRLVDKNAKLERLLKKHENPHSPPRTQDKKAKKPQADDSDGTRRKPGGQPKHRGTTTVPEPDYECVGEFLEPCECGECKVKDIRVDGDKEVIIDYEVKIMTTKHIPTSATCVGCGKERRGKYYHRRIKERSAVPAPPVADPPVQEHAEQVTEPQAEQVTEPQAEQVTEPETTVVADPPVQEHAERVTEPQAEQVTEPETTVVADPPVQEHAEQVTEPQAALESAAETGQKTPVPQAPANSDLQRREIKITRFGMFGMSVIVAILTFWGSRSVIRRIGLELEQVLGISIGTGTTANILTRTAEYLAPEMTRIVQELLKSPYLHMDETVARIAGYQRYIWVVATKNLVLYFPSTRHGTVLKIMFSTYAGIVISDGYHVYRFFKRRQRCWAHLMRDAKDLKKSLNTPYADNFYFKLKDILQMAKEKKAEGVGPEWHDAMDAKLGRLLSYYSRYEDLLPVIKTIRNDRKAWFTFMLYSYVDPTNNWAELLVREVVKQRIMRQALRTMEGAETFSTILSCLGTWHLSGLNVKRQLEKFLGA